ncbi:MAG TPA: formylglycine-generating enzyme family protein [Microscillaceae bacterium]|nr:formylglycine-generating enzyme family protein [Microscillaceae bacterium]
MFIFQSSNRIISLIAGFYLAALLVAKAQSVPPIDMVPVPGGSFMMGCSPNGLYNCWGDEQPLHRVSLSDFYISRYEITQAQWKAVMGENPSFFSQCEQCPVEMVSWEDCQVFIQKLNTLTGKSYRLPTEAEWEYAARGGQQSNTYPFAGSYALGQVAWFIDNADGKTHPVGERQPNELGIYDMTGNVWEWCQDWFSDTYYAESPASNPTGATTGEYRVLRGGSWVSTEPYCKTTGRSDQLPAEKSIDFGFRLVLSR